MTVKLQALAIKSELKVVMKYKNFKAVAMRCKNKNNAVFCNIIIITAPPRVGHSLNLFYSSQSWALFKFILFKLKKYIYIYIYITVKESLRPTKVPRRQEDQ